MGSGMLVLTLPPGLFHDAAGGGLMPTSTRWHPLWRMSRQRDSISTPLPPIDCPRVHHLFFYLLTFGAAYWRRWPHWPVPRLQILEEKLHLGWIGLGTLFLHLRLSQFVNSGYLLLLCCTRLLWPAFGRLSV